MCLNYLNHATLNIYMYVHALGDCLTSRPKGHTWPTVLWFLINSCHN